MSKKIILGIVSTLFLVITSCQEPAVLDKWVDEYITNQNFPDYESGEETNYTFPGISTALGQYQVDLDSSVQLHLYNPTNGQLLNKVNPPEYILELIPGTPYNASNFRKVYIVTDGEILSGPETNVENSTVNYFTNILNVDSLRNGQHTLQPWLEVLLNSTNYYIPGNTVTVLVSNYYSLIASISDAVGDDNGIDGDLSQPISNGLDGTYIDGLQDVTNVEVSVAGGNVKFSIYMLKVSSAWSPDNGFDHLSLHVFLDDPNQTGKTFLPKMHYNVPGTMTDWDYQVFAFGWGKGIYGSADATEESFGTKDGAPEIMVDETNNMIELTVYADNIGSPSDLGNWNVYIATFDYDGMASDFRPVGLTNDTPDHQFHSDQISYFDTNDIYTNEITLDWVGPFQLTN